MKHILFGFAIVLARRISGEEYDYSNEAGSSFERMYEAHERCAEKWHLDTYHMTLETGKKYNESVRCAVQCELEALNLVENGEILIETFTKEYMIEVGAHHSKEGAALSEYVLGICKKELEENQNEEKCGKVFDFFICVEDKEQEYYVKEHIEQCLNFWQDKPLTAPDSEIYREQFCSEGTSFCLIQIGTYIKDNGFECFQKVAEGVGFLENSEEVKSKFYEGLQNCYDSHKAEERKCSKSLNYHSCLLKEFQMVLPNTE